MLFQACPYCDHPNPAGTNFCNDCGAALHLKPCRKCSAVTIAKATECPSCGTAFPARPMLNVDIPWAVPNRDPAASDMPPGTTGEAPSRKPGQRPPVLPGARARTPGVIPPSLRAQPPGLDGDRGDPSQAEPDLSAEALEVTRKLIEKASLRDSPDGVDTLIRNELVLPPPRGAEPATDRGRGAGGPDGAQALPAPGATGRVRSRPRVDPAPRPPAVPRRRRLPRRRCRRRPRRAVACRRARSSPCSP